MGKTEPMENLENEVVIGKLNQWKICIGHYALLNAERSPHVNVYICLTSLTCAKCGTRSTLCWKVGNISGSTELFAL